jgi:hypothetical protein
MLRFAGQGIVRGQEGRDLLDFYLTGYDEQFAEYSRGTMSSTPLCIQHANRPRSTEGAGLFCADDEALQVPVRRAARRFTAQCHHAPSPQLTLHTATRLAVSRARKKVGALNPGALLNSFTTLGFPMHGSRIPPLRA